jgi:hypothetical protein
MRNHQHNTVVHIHNHAIIIGPNSGDDLRQVNLPDPTSSFSAHGRNHDRRADISSPVKRVFFCPSCTFVNSVTPNEMSSSIPLAYLGVRKESEAPSIGRTSRRISSGQAPGDSRQSPTFSSNRRSQDEIEPNEDTDEIVPSIEFEEGGYGWVVTGCKLPNQN